MKAVMPAMVLAVLLVPAEKPVQVVAVLARFAEMQDFLQCSSLVRLVAVLVLSLKSPVHLAMEKVFSQKEKVLRLRFLPALMTASVS